MDQLSEPVVANMYWLLGAGIIMVLALWFSKKSRTVTETEVNLARKERAWNVSPHPHSHGHW